MSQSIQNLSLIANELLTVEGQIVKFIGDNEKLAGEIYTFVNASQSTVSRKIARMVDQGMLEYRTSSTDRRVPIYRLSDSYRRHLQENALAIAPAPSTSVHRA